jgi:type III secretion protein V
VKINDLPLLPAWLVGATQCLVNDTSEGLRRFGRPYEGAVPAVNPGSGQSGAVVDLGGKDVLETAGLTTWDQIQFLILSLAADLRRHGFCLVNRSMVRDHLGRLEGAFPALVKAARGQMSDERITRVVRGLIQEQVSVRDLRSVLELHLDYGLIATSSADWQRHSNEGDLLAFVRAGLRTQVTHASAGYGRRNVVVYLVDPQIERRAVEQQFSPHNEGAEAILDALRSEIAHLPSTVTLPHVLTSREARPVLQQSIASEFPRVLVIAHDELAPNAVVQPIARLTA